MSDQRSSEATPRIVQPEDVMHIVAATGKPLKGDLDELTDAINSAGAEFATACSLSRNYRFSKITSQLDQLAAALKKSVNFLDCEQIAEAVYEENVQFIALVTSSDLKALLEHVVGRSDRQRRAQKSPDISIIFKHSPFEWMIGRHLVRSYQIAFFEEAGRAYSKDGVPEGPFVRFSSACLQKLGINKNGRLYTPSAILEALRKVRRASKAS